MQVIKTVIKNKMDVSTTKPKVQNNSNKGRSSNKKKNIDNELVDNPGNMAKENLENEKPVHIDLETDISQLEPPTFTTLSKQEPEIMMSLNWDHTVHLVGEKVPNPMIHCCDKCTRPILIYGRMIPCKHVFCLACAKKEEKLCPRCKEKIVRVEQTGLGSVFMCTFGGTRYGNAGCRRTYLSQRDLQAHINHRHTSNSKTSHNTKEAVSKLNKSFVNVLPLTPSSEPKSSPVKHTPSPILAERDPRNQDSHRHVSSPTKISAISQGEKQNHPSKTVQSSQQTSQDISHRQQNNSSQSSQQVLQDIGHRQQMNSRQSSQQYLHQTQPSNLNLSHNMQSQQMHLQSQQHMQSQQQHMQTQQQQIQSQQQQIKSQQQQIMQPHQQMQSHQQHIQPQQSSQMYQQQANTGLINQQLAMTEYNSMPNVQTNQCIQRAVMPMQCDVQRGSFDVQTSFSGQSYSSMAQEYGHPHTQIPFTISSPMVPSSLQSHTSHQFYSNHVPGFQNNPSTPFGSSQHPPTMVPHPSQTSIQSQHPPLMVPHPSQGSTQSQHIPVMVPHPSQGPSSQHPPLMVPHPSQVPSQSSQFSQVHPCSQWNQSIMNSHHSFY